MSMVLKVPDTTVPISLSGEVQGHRTGRVIRHVSREIWTYHLFGMPSVPLGTREGFAADDLVAPLLADEMASGHGIVRLKISHARTPLTWLATIFSLGILSPTSVTVEGDVVELLPPS